MEALKQEEGFENFDDFEDFVPPENFDPENFDFEEGPMFEGENPYEDRNISADAQYILFTALSALPEDEEPVFVGEFAVKLGDFVVISTDSGITYKGTMKTEFDIIDVTFTFTDAFTQESSMEQMPTMSFVYTAGDYTGAKVDVTESGTTVTEVDGTATPMGDLFGGPDGGDGPNPFEGATDDQIAAVQSAFSIFEGEGNTSDPVFTDTTTFTVNGDTFTSANGGTTYTGSTAFMTISLTFPTAVTSATNLEDTQPSGMSFTFTSGDLVGATVVVANDMITITTPGETPFMGAFSFD